MKHRLLALLLAACTLLCLVLTSCSKSTDSNQNNSTDAATQTPSRQMPTATTRTPSFGLRVQT